MRRNDLLKLLGLFTLLLVIGFGNYSEFQSNTSTSTINDKDPFNGFFNSKMNTEFPDLLINNYSRITRHDTYFEGSGTCIEVLDDIAFIGYEDEGLLIIDIKHQYEPKLLSIYVVDSIVAIKVVGNYAYILAGYNDKVGYLQIIDIYDPVHPRLIGSYTDVKAHDLAIVGPTAYLTAGIFGLRIINITNPTNPVEISNYSVLAGYPVAVHVIRNYFVYTAEKAGGMRIYDCSNLTNPILLGKFFDGGYTCKDIVVDKDYAYLATDTSGFIIINIKDLENPYFHSQIGEGSISKIKIVGTTGYFVYDIYGVKVYDVKKFANPTLINTIEAVYITDIWFYENYLYATESTNPLKIFDISLSFSEELVSIIPRGIKYRDIVVKDNVAVVATAFTSTIVIYNLTCITDPEIITEISVGGRVYNLELDGSFVYFFEEYGRMYALDISNINNIIIYENIYPNLDFYPPSFTVKDNYAYLLYSSQEMKILSLHDLANVEVIGEIALGRTTDIFVDNSFAYITGYTHDWQRILLMVNVTQPDNPVLYANYSLSGELLYSVKDFFVSDSIIYLTDDEGLRIFESVDSNNLVFLSGYNTTD